MTFDFLSIHCYLNIAPCRTLSLTIKMLETGNPNEKNISLGSALFQLSSNVYGQPSWTTSPRQKVDEDGMKNFTARERLILKFWPVIE